jgi:hypothetical protein
MRKALLVIAVSLFAVPLFAQQSKLQVSVFATDVSFSYSEGSGSNLDGGIGAALEYRWNRHWALELQVTREDRDRTLMRIDPLDPSEPPFTRLHGTAYPIDLLAHYRFDNASRWQPFVGAGIRYERSPFREFDQNRTVFEIDGGVHFMMTPALSLRLDAKQLLTDDNGHFDSSIRPSIGLGWKF